MSLNIIKNLSIYDAEENIIYKNAKTYLGNRGYCIYKNSRSNCLAISHVDFIYVCCNFEISFGQHFFHHCSLEK